MGGPYGKPPNFKDLKNNETTFACDFRSLDAVDLGFRKGVQVRHEVKKPTEQGDYP